MTLQEFLSSSLYLPKPLRDFHNQKSLFKCVGEMKGDPADLTEMPNWVTAHVYTIDFFLWFMARHGYTLQRSRVKVEFSDLDHTIQVSENRRLKAFLDVLKEDQTKDLIDTLPDPPAVKHEDAA